METLFKRLSEPSTYAGLSGLALVFGLNSTEFMTLATAFAGVFSFLGVFVAEAGRK